MKGWPLRLGFQLALCLLLLLFGWWLFQTIDLTEIVQILHHLTLRKGAWLVAANLVVLVTLTSRWWLFLYGLGYPILPLAPILAANPSKSIWSINGMAYQWRRPSPPSRLTKYWR